MYIFSTELNERIMKEIDESDIGYDQKIMLYEKWIGLLSASERAYEYCHPRNVER